MAKNIMNNSIIGRLSNEKPTLQITEDLTVTVEDDLEVIIEASEKAAVLDDFAGNDGVPSKESIQKLKEASDEIFKMLITNKKEYEALHALNIKLQDRITIIAALFTTAKHEEFKEAEEEDRFQE